MKHFSFIPALLLAATVFFGSCHPKLFVIERGCVKDDFTIKLTEQNATLKPNEFFNIDKLNLRVNSRLIQTVSMDFLQVYKVQRAGIVSYPVQIRKGGKTYYGRLAFFGVKEKAQTQAVCTFYKIAIPDDYFGQAVDGRTACVYEYYSVQGRHGGKFPTWVIWMSDIEI